MKRLTALLLSVLMILSAQTVLGLEFTEEVETNIPTLKSLTKKDCTALGTSNQTVNTAQMIVENDKYIFTVVGQKNYDFAVNSVVEVWDKKTGALVTTITQASSNATFYCPVRAMYVIDDVLYISWGNAVNNIANSAQYASGTSDGSFAPFKAYDISSIDASEGVGSGLYIHGGTARTATNAPFNFGGIAYADKENGKIYYSKVSSKADAKRHYVVMDAFDVKTAVKAGTIENLAKKHFYTPEISMNAVQFIVKDGWLFEVLQNKAGLMTMYTGEATLATNNTVYVYDLNGVELSGTTQSVASCLKGTYTTSIAGDDVIQDIEVIGNTLYVATSAGIEVVDLSSAKAEGVTSDSPVTLTAAKTITGIGGARDLEAIGSMLYAGYEGPEVYGSPNSTSQAGSVVIYNTYETPLNPQIAATQSVDYGALDISVNTAEEVIYVMNDTMGPPSMAAYGYSATAPSFESNFVFGSQVTENIPYLTTVGSDNPALSTAGTWAANTAQFILENDKYIFVGLTKESFTACGVVQIFDKKDGSLLATLSEATSNALRYRPIRNMHLYNDVLYVTWGNGWSSSDESAFVLDSVMSPVKAYDVSNVTADSTPTGLTIFTGGQRSVDHAPYILGNISYLDEENGLLYVSQVERKSYGWRYYYAYKTSDLEAAVKAGSAEGLTRTYFGTASMDAAKFMHKDGWFVEVLQNKAGLSAYNCADTLTTNNVVKVYNLSGVSFTTAWKDIKTYLRGTYTTAVAGDTAIRDVEVIGDTLYVTTSAGVEVVDLTPAKASGVTSSAPATLTAAKTLTSIGGARDLEADGTMLFAAFEGPESYKSPNSTSQAGSVVAYDASITPLNPSVVSTQSVDFGALDMAFNAKEQIMYVLNDTQGPPSMRAYSVGTPELSFVSESGTSFDLTAGTYDIKVKLTNPDSAAGEIICALYSGNALSDVVLTYGSFEGDVTVAEDLEISEDITRIKVMYFSDTNSILMPLCGSVEVVAE